MSARRDVWTRLAGMVVIVGFALAACSSAPANSVGTSAQASVGPGSIPAGTATPTKGTVSVDLTFSGTKSLTAKGTAGQCGTGHSVTDGSFIFAFQATETDYPGLGTSFNLSEDTRGLSYKWVVDAELFYAAYFPGGYTLSADHKSLTIDADLGGPAQKTEHLKGTIVCP